MSETYHPGEEPDLLQDLRERTPTEFEDVVADLWKEKGWRVTRTKGSDDKGIDVYASKDGTTVAIQAKKYAEGNKVSRPAMQQYSSLRHDEPNIDRVAVVTTSEFTARAENHGLKNEIEMLDGVELVEQINQVGLFEDDVETDTKDTSELPEERPKTAIRGHLLAVATVHGMMLAGAAMMGIGEAGGIISGAGAVGFSLGFFGSPISITMDVRELNRLEANYRPGYIWAIGSLFTMTLAGFWYLARRVLRTDIRATFAQ
mgnify:CR=1 FL=1